jgi:PAS domain S-box-containing protein
MALPADRTPSRARRGGAPSDSELIDIFDAARNVIAAAPHASEGDAPALADRQILDALGVALYTTDEAGRITFFNRAAAAFWGRRPELGEEWCGSLRLFYPDGRPMRHDECPMAIALREQRPTHGGEATAERPDGSRVAFVAYPTPLFDDSSRMIAAVNVLIDVTERRRAETALREAASALRGSNAVKDEFLGLVSHELRTPVTTIFGNAQLLRDRGETLPPEARRSMLGDIAEDSGRLLGIIENLLVLTRLGSGTRPDLEPQVINHVVRKAVDSFGQRHPERTVTYRGPTEQVIVDADDTYLELLMQNYLSNADKYSPPDGEIEVLVRSADGEAQVLVLDRGIGFGDASSDALFEPFYRAEAAKMRANGIGVGLAVCKRVIQAHHGRVWAEHRDGGGSIFAFALPASVAAEELE